jgi:hypothetical protein
VLLPSIASTLKESNMKLRDLFLSLVLVLFCAIPAVVHSAPVAIIDPNVELAEPTVIAQGRINIGGTWYQAVHVTGRNEAHYLIIMLPDTTPLLVYAILDPTQEIGGKNLALVWSAVDVEEDEPV